MAGIRTLVNERLGHASRLVDLGDGTAAIVDPPHVLTEHLDAVEGRPDAGALLVDIERPIVVAGADQDRDEVVRQRSASGTRHLPAALHIELGSLSQGDVPAGR